MFSILNIFKGSNKINVNELDSIKGELNLIDVREPYEFKAGHLPKAKNIPMNKLMITPEKYLVKEKQYYIICQSGGRSSRTCGVLSKKGFDVVNVSGGTMSYRGSLRK